MRSGASLMTDEKKQKILDFIGQKWVVYFDNSNGTKNMGMCNSHLMLPDIINKIRKMNGKNIVIRDETIFFVDEKPED